MSALEWYVLHKKKQQLKTMMSFKIIDLYCLLGHVNRINRQM